MAGLMPDPKMYPTWQDYAYALNMYMKSQDTSSVDPSDVAVLGTNVIDSTGQYIVSDNMVFNGRAQSGGNLIPDWNFQNSVTTGFGDVAYASYATRKDQPGYYFLNGNSTTMSFGSTGENSTTALRFQDAGNHTAISTYMVDVTPGELLSISVKAKKNSTWTNGLYIRAAEFDRNGTYLSTAPVSTELLFPDTGIFSVATGTLQLGTSTNKVVFSVQLSGASQPAGAIIDINWVWAGRGDYGSTAGAGNQGEVAVQNANFEQGSLRGWEPQTAGVWQVYNDPSNSHQGNWVLKNAGTASSRIYNSVKVPCKPNDMVKFGTWYKTSASFTGSVTIFCQFIDSAGAEISTPSLGVSAATTTWTLTDYTAVAPANTVWVRFAYQSNGISVGNIFLDDSFMNVRTGAVVGTDIYSTSVAAVLTDIDLRNDMVNPGSVASLTYNPNMRFSRRNPAGALAPAGYYRYNVTNNLTYEDDAVRTILKVPATSVLVCTSAFQVDIPHTYTVSYVLRDASSASTASAYVAETSADMTAGKFGISDTGANAETELQTGTSLVTLGTINLTTSMATQTFTYTPTAGVKWASVLIGNGSGRDIRVQQITVTPSVANNDVKNSAVVTGTGGEYRFTSNGSGVYATANRDLTATFYRNGSSIATRVRNGAMDTSGNITTSAVSNSGETTTVSTTGSGGHYVTDTVTHTASNQSVILLWSAVNVNTGGNIGK
jgi:hypothetical protein